MGPATFKQFLWDTLSQQNLPVYQKEGEQSFLEEAGKRQAEIPQISTVAPKTASANPRPALRAV